MEIEVLLNFVWLRKVFEDLEEFSNMAKVIEAIYEKGVFKPLQKVDLKEGERVKIEIKKETILEKLKRYRVKVDEDVLENFLKERR